MVTIIFTATGSFEAEEGDYELGHDLEITELLDQVSSCTVEQIIED